MELWNVSRKLLGSQPLPPPSSHYDVDAKCQDHNVAKYIGTVTRKEFDISSSGVASASN